MAQPLLLALWLALGVALSVAAVTPAGTSEPPTAPTVAPTEAETLQSEADNQENVLSQLLGDYDKVKAVSEGSDCQCKCVVRPMGHDACKRVNAGASRKEDFYTVETITSGPSCKCACVAPPSALNPCEGDFRLQKLREADSRDLKLATIIDMLEGAFYGLDLLKLHSVTTKLVGRVDKLEEVRSILRGKGLHIFLLIKPQSVSNLPVFRQRAHRCAMWLQCRACCPKHQGPGLSQHLARQPSAWGAAGLGSWRLRPAAAISAVVRGTGLVLAVLTV